MSLCNTRISAVSWLAVDALLYAGSSINGAEDIAISMLGVMSWKFAIGVNP